MVAELPILKLFFLGVRQIAKPIANRVKQHAKDSATFKSGTVAVGRALHRFQIQVGRLADGKGSLAHITPLNEAAAVNLGSEFCSELVIYVIAGTTVVFETTRASLDKRKKEAAEEAAEMARRAKIESTERQLCDDINELGKRITSLSDQVWHLQKQQSAVEEKHRQRNRSWSEWIMGK